MKSPSEGTGKRAADSGLGSGSGASSGGGTGGKALGVDDGVCAFCQDDDEVMMCPLCSCRRCFGKQDPSLALLCEVRIVLSFRGNECSCTCDPRLTWFRLAKTMLLEKICIKSEVYECMYALEGTCRSWKKKQYRR